MAGSCGLPAWLCAWNGLAGVFGNDPPFLPGPEASGELGRVLGGGEVGLPCRGGEREGVDGGGQGVRTLFRAASAAKQVLLPEELKETGPPPSLTHPLCGQPP